MNRRSRDNLSTGNPDEIGRSSFSRSTKTRKSAQVPELTIRKIVLNKDSEKIRNAETGKIREKKNASCTTFMENKRGSASTLREVTTWKRLSL
jgi:hypothetical protein